MTIFSWFGRVMTSGAVTLWFLAVLNYVTVYFKLLEHAMKVVERIFEHRIRQHIEIDDMQFRFMW